MKKIPTLFKRVFDESHNKSITREVTPGCEVVLEGWTVPTVKWDGACCAIIDDEIYRRYDAKQKYNKKPPEGAIPCQAEPDPITGHWPHWVKCVEWNPQDKYFLAAYNNSKEFVKRIIRLFQETRGTINNKGEIFTLEAVGPHWQSNPYGLEEDQLIIHGYDIIPINNITGRDKKISFESIKDFLSNVYTGKMEFGWNGPIEGIVFWYRGEPLCKIKRTDFGFEWPIKKGK